MTYLGLIRDITNSISNEAKFGTNMIERVFKVSEHGNDTIGFIDKGETPTETIQLEPQASDIAGISQTQPPSLSAAP